LFIINSELIKEVQSKVTEQQLIENAKQLNNKMTWFNFNLILNIDKTVFDSKKDFDKIKVVSIRECP
jgi:3-phosphoglycerate kinase